MGRESFERIIRSMNLNAKKNVINKQIKSKRKAAVIIYNEMIFGNKQKQSSFYMYVRSFRFSYFTNRI
jgi:hypothetical protein